MERLTERDEYGNADIVGVDSMDLQGNLSFDEFNRVTEALNRLAHYEDLEEQGRLIVLPCKPSDVTVYQLRNKKHAKGIGVSPRRISCARVWSDGTYALEHQGLDACTSSGFGKTWFLTEAEAESALAAASDMRE